MKKTELFLLRTGAVNFKKESGETGILYPIHPSDTDEQIKTKLEIALAVNAVFPEAFDYIQTDKIEKILAAEAGQADIDKKKTGKATFPKVNADGVPVDKNGKALSGGPLKSALAKLEAAKVKEDPKTGFEGKGGEIFPTEAEALASLEAEDEDTEDEEEDL